MVGNAASILEHETGGSTKGSSCMPPRKNRSIAIHGDTYTGRSDRWSYRHEFRSVWYTRSKPRLHGNDSFYRPRCTRRQPCQLKVHESIRINRGGKDAYRLLSLRIAQPLFVLHVRPFHLSICVVYKMSQKTHVFLLPEVFAVVPKRESIVSRLSKLRMIGIRGFPARYKWVRKLRSNAFEAPEKNFK